GAFPVVAPRRRPSVTGARDSPARASPVGGTPPSPARGSPARGPSGDNDRRGPSGRDQAGPAPTGGANARRGRGPVGAVGAGRGARPPLHRTPLPAKPAALPARPGHDAAAGPGASRRRRRR